MLTEREAAVSFVYDAGYQGERYTPALSVSMPKSRREHRGDVARRWIDNLLPDNDDVRERWAADFGERRVTAFNLLRHMGQDCAGAVQVMPSGIAPQTTGDGQPIGEADIEARLRALRRDDSAWDFANHGGRWSLGGAQGKFALARRPDGTWVEPTGRAASTHIIKVGIHAFAHGDVAEFVTMRAAALLGIRVARTEITRFGQESAMVSERYDRNVDADGTVTRLHQEDACQALGLSRAVKYESDGGPGVASIAALLARSVDPRDLRASKQLFATALAYNWLIAGTDAHAKNYSLVHIGSRVRLAPLYDLTSAALLLPPDEVQFKSRLAMKLGGHYKLREIQTRHLVQAAAVVGVDQAWMLDTAGRLTTGLPDAVEQALDEASDVLDDSGRHGFHAGLAARTAAAARTLATGPVEDLPASAPVAPHERSGKTVPGH